MTEQMKPSGIEWIGDIPNDWKIQRFKFCGAVLYGCPFNSDFFTNEDTGIPLIRIRDITSGTISTYYEGHYSSEYMVYSGDVLVGMDGDFNVRIWDNLDALLNQRCCKILSSKKINARYLAYYLPHQLYIVNQLTWSTTVKHLLAEDIGNIPVAYPQLNEQQAIVRLLDKECTQIDSIAADLEKQITVVNIILVLGIIMTCISYKFDWFKKIEPNDDTSITTTQTESIEIQDTEHILPSSPDESEIDQ